MGMKKITLTTRCGINYITYSLTNILIFDVIFATFRPLFPPDSAVFMCLLIMITFMEFRTENFTFNGLCLGTGSPVARTKKTRTLISHIYSSTWYLSIVLHSFSHSILFRVMGQLSSIEYLRVLITLWYGG